MISKKSIDFPPFIVMEILEKAQELEKQGKNIIHLEIGEPDFPTPPVIVEAACRALKEGKTCYTHSQGLYELREEICRHFHNEYKVGIKPEQVIITSGTSPAMLLIMATILDPDEQVILPNPGYACYPNFIRFVDGLPSFVNINEENDFQFEPDEIKSAINSRTKAILINSPSNPTGTVLSRQKMEQISNLGPIIISDEIYHGMVYKGKAHSILEFTDNAFVLNGFSKLFSMTGWRLGYVIAPEKFIRPMQKIQQNFFISANNFVQWAGIAALRDAWEYVKSMVEAFDERRKFLIPELKNIGFGLKANPTGAFYILVNAKDFSRDSYKFALELLNKTGVAVTPGVDFGTNGEGYIRFSYANSLDNIKQAVTRLKEYLLD